MRLPPFRDNEMTYLGALMVAMTLVIIGAAVILVATAVGVVAR